MVGQFGDERKVVATVAVGVVVVLGVVHIGPGEGHVIEFLLVGLVLPHVGLDPAEAMAKLSIANTRMKDFHDVWFLMRRFQLDGPTLRRAIEATFARRQTPLPMLLDPLSDAFANNATKQTQWAAFIRRNSLTDLPGQFAEVVVAIRDYLTPVLRG